MTWLIHSAKGSEWEKHQYIKKEKKGEGAAVYYYPDSYEGGRHLPKGENGNGSGGGGATYGEYSKDDPDFAKENRTESNRIGDTDFFHYTRPDGTVVILEEDMKWVLPPGTKFDAAMAQRIQEFANKVKSGQISRGEAWEAGALAAINGTKSGKSSGGGGSSSGWEKKMYDHIDSIVKGHKDIFKSDEDVRRHLSMDANTDAFKKTLKAISGMDTDSMSEDEINKIRKQIVDHYGGGGSSSGSSSKKSSGKSSKKKEALNKNDDYDYGHRPIQKKEALNKNDDYDYGHRSPTSSSKKASENAVTTISEFTGMKKSAVRELQSIASSKGYNSKEYRDLAGELAEGDEKTLSKITSTLKKAEKDKNKAKHSDTLAHFGILGMSWGKRNGPPYPLSSRVSTGKRLKITTPEEAKERSARKSERVQKHSTSKNLKDISDDDLQKMIRRLELEKRYTELSSPKESKKVNEGREFITGVLKQSAKAVAVAGATYVMGKALNKALGANVINVAKSNNKED